MVDAVDHEAASARRKAQLDGLLEAHLSHVDKAHEDHPTPDGVKFHDMLEGDQLRFNMKRGVIDSANRAYNRQVRAMVLLHQAEEREAAKKFMESAAARSASSAGEDE